MEKRSSKHFTCSTGLAPDVIIGTGQAAWLHSKQSPSFEETSRNFSKGLLPGCEPGLGIKKFIRQANFKLRRFKNFGLSVSKKYHKRVLVRFYSIVRELSSYKILTGCIFFKVRWPRYKQVWKL